MNDNIKSIRASVKITPKINGNFYSFEYSEERTVDPNTPIEEQRTNLWDTAYNEVANQINETIESTK